EARRGERRRTVSGAEVEHPEAADDLDVADEGVAARPHALGDAREVPLLPERLVRIRRRLRGRRCVRVHDRVLSRFKLGDEYLYRKWHTRHPWEVIRTWPP